MPLGKNVYNTVRQVISEQPSQWLIDFVIQVSDMKKIWPEKVIQVNQAIIVIFN